MSIPWENNPGEFITLTKSPEDYEREIIELGETISALQVVNEELRKALTAVVTVLQIEREQ